MIEKQLKIGESRIDKPEIEKVEAEKQEYKIVGKYLRRRGLRLFAYNYITEELKEVDVKKEKTITLTTDNDQLIIKNSGYERAEVDTRNEHFEALNLNCAKNG